MDKLIYTWGEYAIDIESVVSLCKKNKIDHIVAVYRGSLVPGVDLSNKLDIPLSIIDFQSRDGSSTGPSLCKDAGVFKSKNILIIDDIYDSGLTMTKIYDYIKRLTNKDDENIFRFVFFSSKNVQGIDSLYSNEGKWVVFPWE